MMGAKIRKVMQLKRKVCFGFCGIISVFGCFFVVSRNWSAVRTVHYGLTHTTTTTTVSKPTSRRLPQSWYEASSAKPWEPRKVLIFTYARSGSSFTGSIIDHSPDVYYSFEPLLRKRTTNGRRRVLQTIFHCNLTSSAVFLLRGNVFLRHNDTAILHRCFNSTGKEAEQCLKKAEQQCKGHRMIAVKTIRLSTQELREIMTLNPDLAVIFLLRDPRARIWSMIQVFHDPKSLDSLQPAAKTICQTLMEDVNASRLLFQQHPERLRFLRYEDLAQNPLKVSQNIYAFLRLRWTDHVVSLIKGQTAKDLEGSKTTRKGFFDDRPASYSVYRRNSTMASARWKLNIPLSVLRTVQKECVEVLELLGYRVYRTLDEFHEFDLKSGTLGFRFAEQLPFRGDLNY